MGFRITVDRSPLTSQLALAGEMDISVTGRFRDAVDQELSGRRPERITLDLSGLEFIDSTGVAALLAARHAAHAVGCALVLTNPRGMVRRVLDVLGFLDTLTDPTLPVPTILHSR